METYIVYYTVGLRANHAIVALTPTAECLREEAANINIIIFGLILDFLQVPFFVNP